MLTSAVGGSLLAHWDYFIPGALGGMVLEFLQLNAYKDRLTEQKYKDLFKSGLYWICVVGLVVAAGIVAWCMYAQDEPGTVGLAKLFMTGVAVRSIGRDALTVTKPKAKIKLGPPDEISFSDIFS